MLSHRRIVFTLILTALLLIPGRASWAQEASADNQQTDSDEEMLRKAEENVQLLTSKKFVRNSDLVTIKTERQLKKILQLYPGTPLRDRVEENLFQVQEILADHNLKVAHFYADRAARSGAAKGAESRLLMITREFPRFSRMDEVFFLLGEVYLIGERPVDAANYFWKLVCKYPGSKYLKDTFEQLTVVGFDSSKGCDNLKP